MMADVLQLGLLAFLGSVAGLAGGVILLFKKDWAKALSLYATPLAAGVLLAIALLDLFPEAVEAIDTKAFSVVLVVFVCLFLIERFFFYLHHHRDPANHEYYNHGTSIQLVIFGDTIHNFLDGVAIAVAFLSSPSLGLVVAFSAFLHETPHEIADFGILISKGRGRLAAFNINLLSALATFPGAYLAYFYAQGLTFIKGMLLAVAAGFFLYVALTDFLPEVQHSSRGSSFRQALFLLAGILGMVVVRTFFPEI